jgi:Domain of unknown function (DUF6916)
LLDKLKSSDFTPYLQQQFLLEAGGAEPLAVQLLQVTELGAAAPNAPRPPFSIILRGPRDRRLPQKIYTVRHATLGEMEIFLVPVAVDEKGYHYEAVFN